MKEERTPYYRFVNGVERERLEYTILEKWDYDPVHSWYPLRGGYDDFPCGPSGALSGPSVWSAGLPDWHLYEYGEGCREANQLAVVDDIYGYGGFECMYLPEDLSWAVYFSHEDTVTFAGSILGTVKELLADEREHWNKWE